MAETKVIMPQMGESVAEGTVAKWLKKVGDRVAKDENILEISTDKIDVEVPSPAAGVLARIFVEEGQTVEVGTELAVIADSAEAGAAEPEEDKDRKQPEQVADRQKVEPRREKTAKTSGEEKRKFYTPVVLRMKAEHGIDLEEIEGTGLGGRVTKKDVQMYLARREGAPEETELVSGAAAVVSAPAPEKAVPAKLDGTEEVVRMNNVRRRTAEHMIKSVQTSAHVTSMQEVDMTVIARHRKAVKDEFQAKNGFPLTYMAIITKEVAEAIKEFPYMNSSVDGDRIILKKYINIGMAVALEDDTLIVPVIHNADRLSVAGLAHAIWDLAQRARTKRLTLDDIQGGTFTITNHGVTGSVFGTPIINQPQVAILGTGAIKKRTVVVEGDAIAVRNIMYLSLSYDHRIIDGAYGGRFCQRISERLESWEPSRM